MTKNKSRLGRFPWSPILLGMTLLLACAAPVHSQATVPPNAPPVAPAAGQSAVPATAKSLPDSVRPFLVFAPRNEMWFVAASRGKRMLLDIGRVDLEVRRDSALALAYREAVAAHAPVPLGTTFVLRAPWGAERVRASAVDSWNGRIVLVLEGSEAMQVAVQGPGAVTATALRDTTPPGTRPPAVRGGAPTCPRAPMDSAYMARVQVVRDSLEWALRALGPPPYERLNRRLVAASSQVTGCFGPTRVILAVSLRAALNEWTRERIVAIDANGVAVQLKVEDFRFKVHDLLHAVDGDGDGIDDVAAVGRTFISGGTTLMRYDLAGKKLVRIAAGFSWEDM